MQDHMTARGGNAGQKCRSGNMSTNVGRVVTLHNRYIIVRQLNVPGYSAAELCVKRKESLFAITYAFEVRPTRSITDCAESVTNASQPVYFMVGKTKPIMSIQCQT